MSDHHGTTMTFIKKGPDDDHSARVIAPVGETPDHAFDDQPTEEQLWNLIEYAYYLTDWS